MPPEPVTLQQLSSAVANEASSPDLADKESSVPFRMSLAELMKVREDFFSIQRHIYKTQDLVELAGARVLEVIELLDEAIAATSLPSSPVNEMKDEPEAVDEDDDAHNLR